MADQTHDHTVSDPANQAAAPAAGIGTRSSEAKSRARWLLLGAAVMLLVCGFFVWRYLGTYESTDDAQVDGRINAISARVSGYVLEVNVEDQQAVEKGAVLVRIDPRDYQVAIERAKAELADAEATARALNLGIPVTSVETSTQVSSSEADLEATRAGVTAAARLSDAARAQLQQAEANNTRMQADLARYTALVAKDEVSRQTYDQAVATAKWNAASVAAASASVAAAEQQVAQAQGRLAQAQAALQYSRTGPQQLAVTRAHAQAALATAEQKRAALHQAELNLEYCTVVAPVSGVVKKNIEVGTNVQPGRTLLSIVPLDDLWITANFKETQLQRMRPGQRVTISVDAFSSDYTGRVESIAGASGARFSLLPPENATGNYVKVVQRLPVKIALDPGQNKDQRLRLGMSVASKVWLQ
jgi:membrane fusion protein, multidrug efflux system